MSVDLKLPKDTVLPNHIVIIPDGNRRWARARRLDSVEGHKAGAKRAVELMRASRKLGVHTSTFWGLSTENWLERGKREVDFLMMIISKFIDENVAEAKKDGVKIIHLGRKDRLPNSLLKKLDWAEEETKNNKKHVFNIALDHGGQDEIVRAVQNIIRDGVKAENVDVKLIDSYMDTSSQPYPYPDLIIRTSAEQRTSGVLLWASGYAETYWEDAHFPDFTPDKLKEAILDYSRRRRRFGGNDAVEHLAFRPEMVAKFELQWWRLGKIPEGMRFREYAMKHIKEQFGLSSHLATQAARLAWEAVVEENKNKFDRAAIVLRKFYKLIRDEVKLAFEPKIVASMEVAVRKEKGEGEEATREYLAEVYRISLFQAAKAAHLRVLANIEKNKGNWDKAYDYLTKYYTALKERVA